MRTRISLTVALAATLSASAAWASDAATAHPHRHGHHVRRAAPPLVAPAPVQSAGSGGLGSLFKPYAHPGDGDADGLSRDPDDCMKGCIGEAVP